jgi:hypothetical protein
VHQKRLILKFKDIFCGPFWSLNEFVKVTFSTITLEDISSTKLELPFDYGVQYIAETPIHREVEIE